MPDSTRPTLRAYVAARRPRVPPDLRARAVARVAGWHIPSAIAIVVLAGLVIHEAAYHLTGGDEFPLTILAGDSRVFVMSHGGLDAAAVAAIAFSAAAGIEAARSRRAGR